MRSGRRFLRSLSTRVDLRVANATELKWNRCSHSRRGLGGQAPIQKIGSVVHHSQTSTSRFIRFETTAASSNSEDTEKSEESLAREESARELVDEWRHVLGSWNEKQLNTAKDILPSLPPNLAFPLYHRIMKEMDFNCDVSPNFFCSTRFYIPLLESWKKGYETQFHEGETVVYQPPIPDPNEVMKMLLELSKIPGFQYEPIGFSIVLGAAISTFPDRAQAPFMAQDLVATSPPLFRSHLYIVCQLMKTWAISGRNFRQVSEQIDRLMKTVPKPNLVLFNTAIHFYTRNAEMQRVEELVEQMKQHGIDYDASTLSHLTHGYARAGQLRAAYDCLERTADFPNSTEDHVIACAVSLMDACRRRIRAPRYKQDIGAEIEYAEKVQELIRSRVDGAAKSTFIRCGFPY